MPYKSVADCPDFVRKMPPDRARQWMHTWNSSHAACMKDGGDAGMCETRAFKAANAVTHDRGRMASEDGDQEEEGQERQEGLPEGAGDEHLEEGGDPDQSGAPEVRQVTTRQGPTMAFLTNLKNRLRGQVTDAVWEDAVRKARASAGGTARAERLRAASEDPLDVIDLCAHGEDADHRLFVESPATFAEAPNRAPEWIPYFPKPGKYQHPKWGEIEMTPDRAGRFVQNFKEQRYQKHLPVNIEHAGQLSGAVGWISDMRQNEDGSVDARVDWSERGQRILTEDRFRYISPEFFEKWNDPATGETHDDIAIGAAVTTRPFFKDKHLRPLVASEEGLFEPEEESRDLAGLQVVTFKQLAEVEKGGAPVGDTTNQVLGMTEDQVREFNELKAAVETLKTEKEAAETQAKEAREIALQLLEDRQRRTFREIVAGQTADSKRWPGDVGEHVDHLIKLSEVAGGPESDLVKGHIKLMSEMAAKDADADIFRPIGTEAQGSSTGSAVRQFNEMLATLKGQGVEGDEAMDRIVRDRRDLYDAYRQEVSVKV